MKSIMFGFAVLAAISSTSYATCREITGPKGTEEQCPHDYLAANRAADEDSTKRPMVSASAPLAIDDAQNEWLSLSNYERQLIRSAE